VCRLYALVLRRLNDLNDVMLCRREPNTPRCMGTTIKLEPEIAISHPVLTLQQCCMQFLEALLAQDCTTSWIFQQPLCFKLGVRPCTGSKAH
jgi:hypothetical protein